MSYSLVLNSRQFALGVAIDASTKATATAVVAPPPAGTSKECLLAGESFTKAAQYVGLTSDAVKKVISGCCESFKHSHGNAGERTKQMAECFARAAAMAGAAAACTAAVVTAPFAGVCGTVGAFLADRVMGYNKTQLAAGVLASMVCSGNTTCFYIGAEIVGWVGDKLGPIIEGIFHPGAAAAREWAKRRADASLYSASLDTIEKADAEIIAQWSASINRIWDLYEGAIPPGYRAVAAQRLGFGNSYQSIASAMRAAGIPTSTLSSETLSRYKADGAYGCESYGKKTNGSYGPLSSLCPPFIAQSFRKAIEAGTSSHDTAQLAGVAAQELLAVVNTFFSMLPQIEIMLSVKIAVVAVGIKEQEAADQVRAYTRAQFASKAANSAGIAEAAADAALKGNAAESKAAVLRARTRYDQAVASYQLILASFGQKSPEFLAAACASDSYCKKASVAVERAKVASDLAVANAAKATTRRVMVGTGVAAGAAGIVYLLLRK